METNEHIIILPGTSDLEVKKSHFISAFRNVRNEDEIREFLEEVRRTHREARHNCFAYRYIDESGNLQERFSDDGEPQGTAGKPMLEILKGRNIVDVCAVVTRYFGGTLLGTGGLFKAYTDSLKEGLEDSVIEPIKRGVRAEFTLDYPTSNKVKYLAQTMDIFTENEEYSDVCKLSYLVDEEKYAGLADKIVNLSNGKSSPQNETQVLFYNDNNKPVVYKQIL
ncbi:MAG: YigZ family protein [Eubacteriales bacterium]|nr:YigZ family protein [Eubacteriales bacterium]